MGPDLNITSIWTWTDYNRRTIWFEWPARISIVFSIVYILGLPCAPSFSKEPLRLLWTAWLPAILFPFSTFVAVSSTVGFVAVFFDSGWISDRVIVLQVLICDLIVSGMDDLDDLISDLVHWRFLHRSDTFLLAIWKVHLELVISALAIHRRRR